MLLLKLVSRDSLGHVPKNLLSMCLIVHIDFGWVAGKLQKGEYLYVLLSTLHRPVVSYVLIIIYWMTRVALILPMVFNFAV